MYIGPRDKTADSVLVQLQILSLVYIGPRDNTTDIS